MSKKKQRKTSKQATPMKELEQLFALSPAMLCVIDFDGSFKHVNQAWEETVGFKAAELLDSPYLDTVHPDDQEKTAAAHQSSIKKKKAVSYINRHCCKDGSYRWLQWHLSPLQDQELLLGIVHDITTRKQTEKALYESQEQFEELVNNLPIGIYRNTPGAKGRFLEANPAIVAMFEAGSKEDFLAHKVSELYKNPEKRAQFAQKLAEQGFVQNEELELVTLKGESFWGSVTAVKKTGPDGEIFFDGVIRDISERKQAEQSLARTIATLNATLESTAEGILVVDTDDNIVNTNRQFLEIWNIPEKIAASANAEHALAHIADQLENRKQFLNDVQEQHAQPEIESADTLHLKDGRIFELQTKPQQVENDIVGCVWSFRDITERWRAQEVLRQAHDELEQRVEERMVDLAERLRYEQALAAAAQSLLSDDENALNQALHHLLEATQVSHIYIFENFEDSENGLCTRITHEALAPEIDSLMDVPALQHVSYQDGLARWQKELSQGQIINSVVTELPKSEQTFLKPAGVQSILLLPIMVTGNWHGFVGFSEDKQEKQWREEDRELLQTAVALIDVYIENKQTAKALAESEVRFRRLVNSAADSIFVHDMEGNIVDVNQRACDNLGYSRQELMQLHISDVETQFDAQQPKPVWDDLIAGKSIRRSGIHQRKDGSTFPVEISLSAIEFGDTHHLIATGRDISKRLEVQKALEEQRHFLRQIIDVNPHFIFAKDREGRFVLVNEALARAYGTTVDGLVGKTDADFNPNKEEVEAFREDDLKVMETQEEKVIPEEIITDASGNTRWLQTIKRPIVDENGRANMVMGVSTDITARKEAEEALRESEQRLSLLIQQSPLAVIEWDMEFRVRGWNLAAEKIFGYAEEEAQGQHASFIIPEEVRPLVDDVWQGLLAQTGGTRSQNENITADGRKIICEWYNTPLVDEHGDVFGVASLVEDISERVRLAQQAQKSSERRYRQVQLSTQIAQEIATAPDLPALYQQVVTLVKEQFAYYYVQLLRYDPSLDTVTLVVGYGEIGEKMLEMNHSVPLGVGLIGVTAATGQSTLRSDVSEDPNWHPNPLLPETKGELAVPIKLGDEVLGVLDVQSDTVNELNDDDQLLLEGLCGQIAIAIESTNLRQEMEQRLQELNTLQRYMTREGWEEFQATRQAATPGYLFNRSEVQALPAEIRSDQNGKNGKKAQEILNAEVITKPLTVRGEDIGMIGIQEDPDLPLSPEDENFLASVSAQIAEALEAARLLEQTQTALTVQEQLSTELRTVAEVSTVTSTIMEADRLLQQVVDLTKVSFSLYHAHIYLYDEENKSLSLKAGAGEVGRLMALEERFIPINEESIVARTVRQREPVVVNDTSQSEIFLPNPLLPDTRSELAVPMIVGESVMGVLDVQSDQIDRFGDQDVLIMRTLAAQIAVAIQNAEQFAEQVHTAEKLREVDQLKSEFLASMSHELRTPLNSIIGFADVLLEGLDGDLNERMEQDVRLIRESGRHLRELIGDILDMSKIEAGRMELRYEEIDIYQMANDLIATAKPLAQEKSLDLSMNLEDDLPVVQADRTRLRQVLWNIMGNAIKFTEEGGVTLAVKMQDENNVLFSIRDTGIGIKPENLPIVFQQFRQVDGALNRKAGGTGLGMPISKKLIELHGGDIWVESTVGKGSTFWFTVPCKPPEKKGTAPLPDIES